MCIKIISGLLTGAHKHNTTIPGLLQIPVTVCILCLVILLVFSSVCF